MSAAKSDRPPQSLLDHQIEPFLQQLRNAGYAERTLRKKRTVAKAFARWAKWKVINTADLDRSHIAAFVARSPRKRKAHVNFELSVMRLFVGYLCAKAGLRCPPPPEPTSVTSRLLRQYENHLRKDRGLAENSLRVYLPLIRNFLAAQRTPTSSWTSWSTKRLRSSSRNLHSIGPCSRKVCNGPPGPGG